MEFFTHYNLSRHWYQKDSETPVFRALPGIELNTFWLWVQQANHYAIGWSTPTNTTVISWQDSQSKGIEFDIYMISYAMNYTSMLLNEQSNQIGQLDYVQLHALKLSEDSEMMNTCRSPLLLIAEVKLQNDFLVAMLNLSNCLNYPLPVKKTLMP